MFKPWSRKISRAVGKLSQCAITSEPANTVPEDHTLQSLGSTKKGAAAVRSLHWVAPTHHNLRKPTHSREIIKAPAQPKINKNFKIHRSILVKKAKSWRKHVGIWSLPLRFHIMPLIFCCSTILDKSYLNTYLNLQTLCLSPILPRHLVSTTNINIFWAESGVWACNRLAVRI